MKTLIIVLVPINALNTQPYYVRDTVYFLECISIMYTILYAILVVLTLLVHC